MVTTKSGATISIGQVVKRLQEKYPDLTVTKVRYLEDMDLLSPERTPGGYRAYKQADIDRLDAILNMQQNHFYPLHVIKEKLESKSAALVQAQGQIAHEDEEHVLPSYGEALLEDIPRLLGVEISYLRELMQFGLIKLGKDERGKDTVDKLDFPLIKAAWDLKQFGLEPRHLKTYLTSANRESVLFSQVLSGLLGTRQSQASQEEVERFNATYQKMEALTATLRSALIHRHVEHDYPGHGYPELG